MAVVDPVINILEPLVLIKASFAYKVYDRLELSLIYISQVVVDDDATSVFPYKIFELS